MIDLTQGEANLLLAMEKHRTNDDSHRFSALRLEIPLQLVDQREHFLLDIGRGRINLLKGTYQTRAKQAVILARLDFGGQPHRNPVAKRFLRLICTFFEKVSRINGPSHYPLNISPILTIQGFCSVIFFDFAT